MKKLLLIIILVIPAIGLAQTSPSDFDSDTSSKWIRMDGISEKGKIAFIKYQLTEEGKVCLSCGFKIYGYSDWELNPGKRDDKGFFVEYNKVKYYFFILL